jgi:hypothetical protein
MHKLQYKFYSDCDILNCLQPTMKIKKKKKLSKVQSLPSKSER